MKLNVNDSQKIVVIILSHKAQSDSAVQTYIDELCEYYKETKYRIGIFHSGNQDLAENTALLLRENR